jgi:DNA-3-methyladenine glycosylase II
VRPRPLDARRYRRGLAELAARDADLGRVLDELGPPPMWDREPGFQTLVHIILEQQVSLASARACLDKLLELVGELTPARLLALDEPSLRGCGFSRQKAAYARGLAAAVTSGGIDLDELADLPDDEARRRLTGLRGVGRWTADIYLLMALGRPDVWPVGDLALVAAAQRVKGLEARPDGETFRRLGDAWRPWRSVAARLLWHRYLADRGMLRSG